MSTSWRDKYPESFLRNGDETNVKDLMDVIFTTKTNYRPLPGFETNTVDIQDRITAGLDCDEVFPGIFIGDAGTAKNKAYLKKIGVTHVLNTAEGTHYGMVNTNRDYYRHTDIKYMGLQLTDVAMTNIGAHFYDVADFVEEGLSSGGKVLVHCLMGMSRSSTCVLAYLMIKHRFSAEQSLRMVRLNRDIRPNDGFLRQLAELDNKLRRERRSVTSQKL